MNLEICEHFRRRRTRFATSWRTTLAVSAVVAAQWACGSLGGPPLPEFFGVYAITEGRLSPLIGGAGKTPDAEVDTEIYNLETKSSSALRHAVYKGEVRLLIYDADVKTAVSGVELFRLPYARNMIIEPDELSSAFSVFGGRRPAAQVRRLGKYALAQVEGLRCRLLQKPVQGHAQMIELVPEAAFRPGLYAVFLRRESRAGTKPESRVFAVESITSEPFCIDLKSTGGYGGMIEEHDSEGDLPRLSPSRYKPCGGAASRGAGPVEANETSAIRRIREIHTAQVRYYSQYGRYAATLAELGPPVSGPPRQDAADYLGAELAGGKAEDYLFTVVSSSNTHAVKARPMSSTNGRRTFYSDQSQVIRQNSGPEPAGADSPEVK